jgi:nucleotide-binding universal stress UspA family protein
VPIRQVLVGVDRTAAAQQAIAWCMELAADLSAEVTAVHVVPSTWLVELSALQIDTKGLIARTRVELLGAWTEPFRQRGVQYDTQLLQGDPGEELVRAASSRHADLLVIGGSHHSGVRDALLGGTAHRVVNRCSIPVVVVPTPRETAERWTPIPG